MRSLGVEPAFVCFQQCIYFVCVANTLNKMDNCMCAPCRYGGRESPSDLGCNRNKTSAFSPNGSREC